MTLCQHLSLSAITLGKCSRQYPVSAEVMNVNSSLSVNVDTYMGWNLEEKVTYKLTLTSPAVPITSC